MCSRWSPTISGGWWRNCSEAGIDAPVFLMHSGGGLVSVETAIDQPVRLLESGPAGGAIYAAGVARGTWDRQGAELRHGRHDRQDLPDRGGTPKTANTFEVARTYRFKKGSGMLISTPVVEMVEIGAGGGSIAWVDGMGRLRVGPHSAGSEPGPACYGRGGEAPAVTDANLALGRLDPENFAGGAIPLHPDRAEAALETLGLMLDEAAFGITEMVDENMANAARVHTVENGRDIAQFTMVAFGGGAPLHACRLCEKLGLREALIPPGAGVGSAIGFLQAPVSFEATRGLYQRLDRFDADAVNAMLADLSEAANAFVDRGAGEAARKTRLIAQMRYVGQGWEIPVALPHRTFTQGDRAHDRRGLRGGLSHAFRTHDRGAGDRGHELAADRRDRGAAGARGHALRQRRAASPQPARGGSTTPPCAQPSRPPRCTAAP
jgi:N-methylhydantoinase A